MTDEMLGGKEKKDADIIEQSSGHHFFENQNFQISIKSSVDQSKCLGQRTLTHGKISF